MMRRRSSRLIAVVTSTLLVLTALAVPASAHPRDGGDGSAPLPGYTITNPPLAPLTVDGRATRVVQGVYRHAAFDLEIPAHWNGQLVMWAHGYRGDTTELTVDPPGFDLRQTFVQQGYAWAASSYYANAYDVRAGVLSTHDLAVHVRSYLTHRPSRTYITGVSMGGHVIGRSLEQYPHFYAGALPMCGVLGDNRLFDFFLDYNLVAQALSGVHAYPVPADYQTAVVPRIEAALGLTGLQPGQNPANARGRQLQQITIDRSGGQRPGDDASFGVWKDFLFSLVFPENGGTLAQNPPRVAQNLFTRYTPNTPVNVNRTVQRVLPTDLRDRLTLQLTQIPRIVGRPDVPVVSLHGLGDMFVPFSMEQLYAREVAWHGQSRLLVQRAVREAGHCEYTPTEASSAWNDLTRWVRTGHRPAGDNVTDPRAVASPTYGCRFTDPKAYADPASFPTRALYPRCRAKS